MTISPSESVGCPLQSLVCNIDYAVLSVFDVILDIFFSTSSRLGPRLFLEYPHKLLLDEEERRAMPRCFKNRGSGFGQIMGREVI